MPPIIRGHQNDLSSSSARLIVHMFMQKLSPMEMEIWASVYLIIRFP